MKGVGNKRKKRGSGSGSVSVDIGVVTSEKYPLIDSKGIDIEGGYKYERKMGHHIRKYVKYKDKPWNCRGWLPWINFGFMLVLATLIIVLYIHWLGNGSGVESLERIIELRRSKEEGPPREYLLSKPNLALEEPMKKHRYANHENKIEFRFDSTPGIYTRYPKEGMIEGLDPKTILEHRLCCHVGDRLFICDYGQGASMNVALECIVEYNNNNENESDAHLLINIQSEEMKDSKCIFTWKYSNQGRGYPPLASSAL